MGLYALAGAISMAVGVALGAFGAHALKKRVSADSLRIWETANRYHFAHALGLFAVAWLVGELDGHYQSMARWAGMLHCVGTVLFSGSLYVMTVRRMKWLGPITPLGGLAWIVGWVCLAVAAYGLPLG